MSALVLTLSGQATQFGADAYGTDAFNHPIAGDITVTATTNLGATATVTRNKDTPFAGFATTTAGEFITEVRLSNNVTAVPHLWNTLDNAYVGKSSAVLPTAAVVPANTGTLTCNPAAPGATSMCTAVPNTGYRTQSISGCGGTPTAAGVNSYPTGALNSACTVTATFDKLSYAITATPTPADAATAGGSLSCPASATHGETKTCTATPITGYQTKAISGCGGTPTSAGMNAYTTGTITAACSVAATFEKLSYTITATPTLANAATAGGSLSCPASANHGETKTCTATPITGYQTTSITGCSGTPTAVGVNSYTTGAITAACSVNATFEKLSYAITATPAPADAATAGGRVVCTPNPVAHEADATCTATAEPGHMLTSWGDACSSTAASAMSCTLAKVTATQTVSAKFGPVQTSFSRSTVPGAGTAAGQATASFTGGGATCRFDAAATAFVAAPTPLPAGQTMPHGMLQFKLTGCDNTPVAVSISWPAAVDGISK